MKVALFILVFFLLVCSAAAQEWQVTCAIDIQGFASVDNSCYDPDGCVIPTPDIDVANAFSYIPGALNSDYGISRTCNAKEDQWPGMCCGNHTWAHGCCFAFSTIDGDNTDYLTIRYGIDAGNQAGMDCFYECQSIDSMTFTVWLDIVGGPSGTPVTVNYSWDHFAGIGGAHDAVCEDSCKSIGLLFIDSQGEVLQNRFDFGNASAPGGMWGWNRKQNQTGTLNRVIGNQVVISGTFRVEANTRVPPPPPGTQTLDDQSASQWGQIRLSLGTPIIPSPPDSLYTSWHEFSVDIGSDAEMSDPAIDGDEVFDPGDCYMSSTVPLPPGGLDGIVDDESFFGYDPYPLAPDGPPPLTGAPVDAGIPVDSLINAYFDLDGEDHLDFELIQYDFGPGLPPISYFPSPCTHDAEYLYISFDDDAAPHYTALGSGAPINTSSPMVYSIYGTAAEKDEITGLSLFSLILPAPVYFKYSYLDEEMLHVSLGPDPVAFNNNEDDDVDALDIRDDECYVAYFSVDHEAAQGLDPGFIYEGTFGGYTPVICDSIHLGLPASTDIDAFEFAWIPGGDVNLDRLLALLFSVDDDDPATPEDESGGLDPAMIYASYLNGWYFEFLETTLVEDVDAIAAWETSLFTGYASITPCDPVDNLVIMVDALNSTVTLMFEAPQDAIYTIYETTNPNADPAPSSDWTSLVDLTMSAGDIMSYDISYGTMPLYMNYAVVATCP